MVGASPSDIIADTLQDEGNEVADIFCLEKFLLCDILHAWEEEWLNEMEWQSPDTKNLLRWSEGGSMKGLLEAAKLFVQTKIAGSCPYHPRAIFCLHIQTQRSRIQDESRKASEADPALWKRWRPYMMHLGRMMRLVPSFEGVAFRAVAESHCTGYVETYLEKHLLRTGNVLTWSAVVSGTSDPIMAHSLMLNLGNIEKRTGEHIGILYKILEASVTPVSQMSSFPEQHEVLFPRGSRFQVLGHYKVTSQMLYEGVKTGNQQWGQDCTMSTESVKQKPLSFAEAGKLKDVMILVKQLHDV